MTLTNDFKSKDDDLAEQLHCPASCPDFAPALWANDYISNMTRSYSYALNIPSIADCSVGRLRAPSSLDYPNADPVTPESLAKHLKQDGLYYLGDMLPGEGNVIACLLKPATSINPPQLVHARRDSNGLWSCRLFIKRVSWAPRQEDLSGNPMTDIRTANLGDGVKFLGFASLPYAGVKYRPRVLFPAEILAKFHGRPAFDGMAHTL